MKCKQNLIYIIMDRDKALEIAKLILEYETLNEKSLYNGKGNDLILWFILRLYEHGFKIS